MANSTLSGVDSTLAVKCLDFCQVLSSQGMEFNFTLNLGNSFNFSLDTRKKSKTTEFVKKKLSPSSVRRNTRRKEAFLKKKGETFNNSEGSSLVYSSTKEVETIQCDHCDYQVNCKVNMRKHMDKEHTVIPQLDGLVNLSGEAMKEEPAAFEMGTDGYPKVKPIDPEVTPPQRVFHPDLGVGDNVVQTELWNATWWQYTFHNFRGSGEDFQRRIYVVKKNSL